jgi:hypothetical protein
MTNIREMRIKAEFVINVTPSNLNSFTHLILISLKVKDSGIFILLLVINIKKVLRQLMSNLFLLHQSSNCPMMLLNLMVNESSSAPEQ